MVDLRMPTRHETLSAILAGLKPYAGDWNEFVDGLEHLLNALLCWAHLALRVVMVAAFPLTVVLLYPLVRRAQRTKHVRDQERERKHAEMVAELTKVCSKPLDPWPDWSLQDAASKGKRE